MESSVDRVVSSAPLHAIRERRDSRRGSSGGRDPRSSGFQRALGEPDAAATTESELRSQSGDAGVPLDEEPGRIVDFAA